MAWAIVGGIMVLVNIIAGTARAKDGRVFPGWLTIPFLRERPAAASAPQWQGGPAGQVR